MRKLNAVELCFYKLLLLKSEIFKNKIIDLNYLEQQTKIDSHRLFEPLKNLLKDKIILFHNEELSCDYIEAYREERKKFEIENMGANNFSDFKETELCKKYYTDGHCGLDKKVFDKLKKEKKTHIGIDDIIFQTLGVRVNPLSYLSFELSIDKSSLRKYLDSYLADFVSNKFNPGDRYTYSKQAQAIVIAIQKLIDAGYPKESLLIDPAQIFPKNMIDVRPTDGQQKTSILLYDFVDTALAMEREGFLKILDIQYQEKVNKMITHSGQIWTDPIKIRISLANDFSKLFLKYIEPSEYEALEKMESQLKDMQKNPEKFRKIAKENNKRKKEELEKIYSKIDYNSKAERKGWEKKWNVLQIIWSVYISANRINSVSIPTEKLTTDIKISEAECQDILKGLQEKEYCISHWYKKYNNYFFVLNNYNDTLANTYNETKQVYEKFAEEYRKSHRTNENKDDKISYQYNAYPIPTGKLKVNGFSEIVFTKIPAEIIQYFYLIKNVDTNYKTYKDFNSFVKPENTNVISDEFSKKINEINNRVSRETKNFIKETIVKGENKRQEANIYKWNDTFF